MLFEYAVEPQAIGSNWQSFRYIIEKFGFDRGRLISRFPGKWERKVILAAREAGVPEIRMASIVQRLKHAKLWVVDTNRPYDHEQPWIDNALTEHLRAPFHAIIALQNSGENANVLAVADLDERHPLMAVAQDRTVTRDAKSIAAALTSFLRIGARILFVDPFFDPYDARFKSTLRECLAVVKLNNSESNCEIHYRHHKNKPSNVEIEKEASNLFKGVIPDGMTVAVYCWREKSGGADFHARYLLTERGGIGIDAGLSAEGAHQSTDMHLMGLVLLEAKLAAFARDATEFELVEPVLKIHSDGTVERLV